jgi:hypothetical protein
MDGILGGKLKGYGNAFIQAGQKYGVDPSLLAAIAMHETGNGSSKMVQQANNVGGITKGSWTGDLYTASTGAKFRAYGSMQEGIDDLGRLIGVYKNSYGLTTVGQIGNRWAPSGASNDPNGLNNHWAGGVNKFYQQLTGSAVVSSSGTATSSGGGGGSSYSGGSVVDYLKSVGQSTSFSNRATLAKQYGISHKTHNYLPN